MSSHLHLIAGTSGKNKLEDIIRDIKKYTAVKIIRTIKNNSLESRRDWMIDLFEKAGLSNSNNTQYQFWQQHYHPVELSTNKMIGKRLDYLPTVPRSKSGAGGYS